MLRKLLAKTASMKVVTFQAPWEFQGWVIYCSYHPQTVAAYILRAVKWIEVSLAAPATPFLFTNSRAADPRAFDQIKAGREVTKLAVFANAVSPNKAHVVAGSVLKLFNYCKK